MLIFETVAKGLRRSNEWIYTFHRINGHIWAHAVNSNLSHPQIVTCANHFYESTAFVSCLCCLCTLFASSISCSSIIAYRPVFRTCLISVGFTDVFVIQSTSTCFVSTQRSFTPNCWTSRRRIKTSIASLLSWHIPWSPLIWSYKGCQRLVVGHCNDWYLVLVFSFLPAQNSHLALPEKTLSSKLLQPHLLTLSAALLQVYYSQPSPASDSSTSMDWLCTRALPQYQM